MKNPRFSIIIPTLNEEKYLPRLLASLVTQTIKDFEVIIVDGSSKDKTIKVAESFRSTVPRLQVIISKKASLPLQRNLGARASKGTWLVFVDADSVLLPYCLERAWWFIQKTDTSFFATWCQADSDKPKDALYAIVANSMIEGGVLFDRPLAPGPFSVVRHSVFDAVNGYDDRATFGEDLDFTLRVRKEGIVLGVLRETLYILSFRRIRNLGGFKMATQYAMGGLSALFFNKALKNMPGYLMGGHMYDKHQKPIKGPVLRQFEKKLKQLMNEVFR